MSTKQSMDTNMLRELIISRIVGNLNSTSIIMLEWGRLKNDSFLRYNGNEQSQLVFLDAGGSGGKFGYKLMLL